MATVYVLSLLDARRWRLANATAHYGIRTDRYKLIYYYARSLGKIETKDGTIAPEWELYDLEKDPKEMHNIYNDPQNQFLINKLKLELLRLEKEYGDDDELEEMKRLMTFILNKNMRILIVILMLQLFIYYPLQKQGV